MKGKFQSIAQAYGLVVVLVGAILVAVALLLSARPVVMWILLGFAGGLAIGVPPWLALFWWVNHQGRVQDQPDTLPFPTVGWGGGNGRSKAITMLLTRGGNFVAPEDQEEENDA